VDSGPWVSCASPHTTSALGEGTHTFEVAAVDQAENTDPTAASWSGTFDFTPPETTCRCVSGFPDKDCTFKANEDATFECRKSAGSWYPCLPPQEVSAIANFAVRAIDLAGNVDPTPCED